MPGDPVSDIRVLIRRAFDQARISGKLDWSIMTVAVLKNRLLDLTERRFDERSYGVDTIIALLESLPDLVTLDHSSKPPRVKLVDSETLSLFEPVTPMSLPTQHKHDARIRRDLWDAIMDYSSGLTYQWIDGQARRTEHPEPAYPNLPTITADDLRLWRRDFADSLGDSLLPDEAVSIRGWLDGAGRTLDLPARLRPQWNQTLQTRVAHRLTDWFNQRGDTPPPLVHPTEVERHQATTLRQFLVWMISRMTSEELAQVQMPASAIQRLLQP